MDINFALYGDPGYPFGSTQDKVVDDTPGDEAAEINMIRKNIANMMARNHNIQEIP